MPTAADTAVFDPGADGGSNVTFNAIQDVCGVKVLSGYVTLGVMGVTRKYLRMHGDADGNADVYVAGGAYLRVNCSILPYVTETPVFRKRGAGSIGVYGTIGDADCWIDSTKRQGFTLLDVGGGGRLETLKNGTCWYATNVIVRADTTWYNGGYNTMMYGEPYVYLEKGASFRTYDRNDMFGALEGYGFVYGGSSRITFKRGACRFDGQIGNVTASGGSCDLTFAAQGTLPDADYSFTVGNTNVLAGLSHINYLAEPSTRAVTNCPLKFAAGIGRFNFYVLNCKKGAPLLLEDVAGEPVDVYATNLGDNNGQYTGAPDFAVTGKGNFYVRHEAGSFRRWSIPFTNDVFRSTGEVGSYSDGTATFGDGNAAHDPDLSRPSCIVARESTSKVVFNNAEALAVPALRIAGTMKQASGAGPLAVAGATTGAGTYTLTSQTTFDGPVAITGQMNVNAPATFNAGVTGGTYAVTAETRFNGPVVGGTYTLGGETTFADDVSGGTFTINAATTYRGAVRDGAKFTINAETAFEGDLETSGTLKTTQPTTIGKLVTSEGSRISFNQARDLSVATDGRDAWVNAFASSSPQTGTLVVSNGCFHSAFFTEKYENTGITLMTPGPIPVTHPRLRVDCGATLWLKGYTSSFSDITVAAGGILYQYGNFPGSSGCRVTLDGGEWRCWTIQSYGHDWIPNSTLGAWTFYVTERGGRICDYTWRTRGGTWERPTLEAAAASGAAEGKTPGELVLSFMNQITLDRPLATGGRVFLESGFFLPGANTVCTSAFDRAAFFGTGDLALGCATLYFGDKSFDMKAKFAADGQKVVLRAPALLVGRYGNYTPQTFTFGDGAGDPFARERGGCLVLLDCKTGKGYFDGSDVKVYVKGAQAAVDPATHILKAPIVGSANVINSSGQEINRLDFLTQDADGLLKRDASVYTEGVEGGATTVARISAATTLAADAQVAALNLDGCPLTVSAGATLKVGCDSTDYPAVILTRHTKDSWGGDPCGHILGTGTLDFGASEGLVIAGRSDRTCRACQIACRITGSGGLSIAGVSRMETNGGALDLCGDNTYTGGTTVGGADVRVRSANALSSGPVRITGGGYNGGRVRFVCSGTFTNDWIVSGSGAFLFGSSGLEPGCLVFNADATLTGRVRVERSARFSTSRGMDSLSDSYCFGAGTGVFAGEISGGRVELACSRPASQAKTPIVFTHHNSYTGGTMIAGQDLILRGDGDCGSGKVVMANSSVLTFENTAEKTFPSRLEGVGWVKLAGSAPVHFTGGVKRESWCNVRLDLAGTSPIFTETPPFATITNTSAKVVNVTLRGDMTLDPSDYTYLDPNVRVRLDGGTVDLAGGAITVERAVRRNGGRFVNGTVTETNPAKGTMVFLR